MQAVHTSRDQTPILLVTRPVLWAALIHGVMHGITGLLYIPNYISQPHHDHLCSAIDALPWRGDLARRVQHYGYVYDYRARRVDQSAFLGPLPSWLSRISRQLHADGLTLKEPDQAIVNEYSPGQGIASHIDCEPCFGGIIVSLSLLSPVVMDLRRGQKHVPILLEPRSLLVLRGEARHQWTHGIARRKEDPWDQNAFTRSRRVSITFRNVLIHDAGP